MSDLRDIAGVVLAGGGSRRFGGKAKAFAELAGKPLIAHALRPLRGLEHIAINANRDAASFASYELPILPDLAEDAGPLGGLQAALAWASALEPGIAWLVSVPVDVPFLPDDFAARLAGERQDVAAVIAATESNFSPVCALWRVDQLPVVAGALERGVRKMTDYLSLISWHKAVLPASPLDPLFNVNSPESLDEAERLLNG